MTDASISNVEEGYEIKSLKSEYSTPRTCQQVQYDFFNLSSNTIVKSIHTKTNGTHVNCCLYKANSAYVDTDFADIAKQLKTEKNKDNIVQQLASIHSSVIPSCPETVGIFPFVELLKSNEKCVEDRVLIYMTKLLFDTNLMQHDPNNLMSCVDVLLNIAKMSTGCEESTINLLTTTLMVLSVQYLQYLTHHDSDDIKASLNNRYLSYQAIVREIEEACSANPRTIEIIMSVQKALQEVCNGHTKKDHYLRVRNWASAVENNDFLLSLKGNFVKEMSHFEKYACLMIIIIQMHHQLGYQALEFLQKCVESLWNEFSQGMPQKNGMLAAMLVLVTKGMVALLDTHVHQDKEAPTTRNGLNQKICGVLRTVLQISKRKPKHKFISNVLRQILQTIVSKVLFHKEESVVRQVRDLITRKDEDMVDKTFGYICHALLPMHFQLRLPCVKIKATEWVSVSGSIYRYVDVTLNVRIPSRECLENGSNFMKDNNEAKILVNSPFINTLEKLRHFSDEESCKHVTKLIAFRISPMPIFYVTEKLDINLSEHLHSERKHCRWIDCNELASYVLDMTHAVNFIHSRHVVHRSITASSFSVRKQNDKISIVLSDFGLSMFDSEIEVECCCSSDVQNLLPTRWTAPESLWDGTLKSDIWMLGMTMYEVFTQGCWPFTELYGKPLEEIIEKVVMQEKQPHRRQCIPLELYGLIIDCTHWRSVDRPELSDVSEELESYLHSGHHTAVDVGIRNQLMKNSVHPPELDQQQISKGEPEKGIPKILKQLKRSFKSEGDYLYAKEIYKNIPSRSRKFSEDEIYEMSEEYYYFTLTPDNPFIQRHGNRLEIEEPVYRMFVDRHFISLKTDEKVGELLNVVKWPPDIYPRNSWLEIGLTHTLKYECFGGESLSDIALTKAYGKTVDYRYNKAMYQAALFVENMHERGWILRDICCTTLYIDTSYHNEVFMPRLGRMMRMDNCMTSCVMNGITNEPKCRFNWLPEEVLQHQSFSVYSDVYMLAMTFYEFYELLALGIKSVASSKCRTIPFYNVPRDQLLGHLRMGNYPHKPCSCPEWLYDIMVDSWKRNYRCRPLAVDITRRMREGISQEKDYEDVRPVAVQETYDNLEGYEHVAERKPAIPPPPRTLPPKETQSQHMPPPSQQDDLSCGNSTTSASVSCANTDSDTYAYLTLPPMVPKVKNC